MNLNSIRISTVRGHAPYKYPPRNTMPKSPGTNSTRSESPGATLPFPLRRDQKERDKKERKKKERDNKEKDNKKRDKKERDKKERDKKRTRQGKSQRQRQQARQPRGRRETKRESARECPTLSSSRMGVCVEKVIDESCVESVMDQ